MNSSQVQISGNPPISAFVAELGWREIEDLERLVGRVVVLPTPTIASPSIDMKLCRIYGY